MIDSLTDEIKLELEKKRYSEMTPEEQRIVIYDQMESIPYNDLKEKPKTKMNIDFDMPLPKWVKVLNSFLLLFFVFPIISVISLVLLFPRYGALKIMWSVMLICLNFSGVMLDRLKSRFRKKANQPHINIIQLGGYGWCYRLCKVEKSEVKVIVFCSLLLYPFVFFY